MKLSKTDKHKMETRKRLLVIPAALLVIPVYIFLHELGHLLVMVACGARILSFSIFTASVSGAGGHFTPFTQSLLDIAGAGFPLLVSLIYVLFFFDGRRQGVFSRFFSALFVLIPVMGLLAWVIVPVVYLFGHTTGAEDVIHFLNHSAVHPILLMVLSLGVFCAFLGLAWKKGVFGVWQQLLKKDERAVGK